MRMGKVKKMEELGQNFTHQRVDKLDLQARAQAASG